MSDLNDIYMALMDAKRAVESLETWQRHVDGRDTVRGMRRTVEQGIAAYEKLSSALRDGRMHIEAPDDYKLTSCGCGHPNASPPCSWCTNPDNFPEEPTLPTQGESNG